MTKNVFVFCLGTRCVAGSRKASGLNCHSSWKSALFRVSTWSVSAASVSKGTLGVTNAFARKFSAWRLFKRPLSRSRAQRETNESNWIKCCQIFLCACLLSVFETMFFPLERKFFFLLPTDYFSLPFFSWVYSFFFNPPNLFFIEIPFTFMTLNFSAQPCRWQKGEG